MYRSKLIPLLLALFLLAACTPPAAAVPTAAPIVLTDGIDRTVTLAAPAQKIVSLSPGSTEILYAIGAGSQIIARDEISDYPAEALELPVIAGAMTGPNYEQIAALQPDLVLASNLNSPEQVKAIEDLGINVFMLLNPTDFDSLFANIETAGALAGRTAEATGLVTSLRQRVDAARQALSGVTARPTVFYELDATDPAKPWTAGPGTFVDYLITQAGGQNIGAALTGEWAQISQEELIVQDPDFILLGDANYGGVTPEAVAARPGWDGLKAVQEGQVLAFDDNLISRPGPRMVDGLVALAKILHPQEAADLK